MRIIENPDSAQWPELLKRPGKDLQEIMQQVAPIMDDVHLHGDSALIKWTRQLDGVELTDVAVSAAELDEAEQQLAPGLKQAIVQAAENIRTFHRSQLIEEPVVETMPGIFCWRRSVGIEKVGIYIPGGSAPLFSTVLMLGIPAQIAGCSKVVLISPPQKDGKMHPAVVFAARIAGISTLYKAGGAQAIAAITYGTESIPAVYKIFGPGNAYVTAAKILALQQGVAIDMPAGPSEVCVMADATANPAFVAADLLSQAEHGADSQVLLIASPDFDLESLQHELKEQLSKLPRNTLAEKALNNSACVVLDSEKQMIAMANAYAAEHLIIAMSHAHDIALCIANAGSIFIGNHSPESVGDYASGTNHTLPTHGYARMYSGVSVDSFVKKITCQHLTEEGLRNIATTVVSMAEAEGLEAHARAVRLRLKAIA